MKGCLVNGHTAGVYYDDPAYDAFWECMQALDVPLYLHPADAYLTPHVMGGHPELCGATWGWGVETGTHALRLLFGGVFDRFPKAKIILGHMGEGLPFSLWRINQALSRQGNRPIPFRDVFCEHFWITTSGNFSNPALLCSVMEMGADRVLFSVDYPFVDNPPGVEWMKTVPLGNEDREKILHGNAERLLKL